MRLPPSLQPAHEATHGRPGAMGLELAPKPQNERRLSGSLPGDAPEGTLALMNEQELWARTEEGC